MALLTLVRHGQASYMAENYDKLSPLGEQQARKLGEFWLRSGTRFQQVFQGPAERHGRTASIVAEVFADAGEPWPEPVTVPEMDEFDGLLRGEVMRQPDGGCDGAARSEDDRTGRLRSGGPDCVDAATDA